MEFTTSAEATAPGLNSAVQLACNRIVLSVTCV